MLRLLNPPWIFGYLLLHDGASRGGGAHNVQVLDQHIRFGTAKQMQVSDDDKGRTVEDLMLHYDTTSRYIPRFPPRSGSLGGGEKYGR